MTDLPALQQFRVEPAGNKLVHLIFDCPGRTMNVFSEAAIADLGSFARWLATADVAGVVVRSGKPNAFCAGADLTELGVAYDMIVRAREQDRFNLAFNHFFPLSSAIRALETAGKPVAAAIAGIALGGGCELALGTHYRVLVDDPKIGLGLPESLVGLLPGAGGTQRLPRLIGVDKALPILLDGARMSGRDALDAGLVHEIVAPGEEIAAAERWVLANAGAMQPWDKEGWEPMSTSDISLKLAPVRRQVLAATLGHYPAPLAILDCLEFGLPQVFDGAIRSEMAIFAHLIQREEARNMIQTLFLAKTDYERLARKDSLPDFLPAIVGAAREAIEAVADKEALAQAGFPADGQSAPLRARASRGYWLDGDTNARDALTAIASSVAAHGVDLDEQSARLADFAVVRETGFPAYLGGPLAFHARQSKGLRAKG
jgi:3-hydroxyacyl-CoA dehydrogenase / enoyl-CoA hydratase / 3-hydroxybutyryl-CoA epimerase